MDLSLKEVQKICSEQFTGLARDYCDDISQRCLSGQLTFTGATGKVYQTAEPIDCFVTALESIAFEGVPADFEFRDDQNPRSPPEKEALDQPELSRVLTVNPSPSEACHKRLEQDPSFTVDQYLACLSPEIRAEKERDRKERYAAEARSNFWGQFGVRVAGLYGRDVRNYKGVFSLWNRTDAAIGRFRSGKETADILRPLAHAPSDDAGIADSRFGYRIGFTTEPGIAIINKNWLLEGTAFEVTGYTAPSGSFNDLLFTFIDATASYAIAERSFFDFGGGFFAPDIATWSHSFMNANVGVTFQAYGAPLGASEKDLTLTDAYSFAQNHILVSARVYGALLGLGDSGALPCFYKPYYDVDQEEGTLVTKEGNPLDENIIYDGSVKDRYASLRARMQIRGNHSLGDFSLNYLLYGDLYPAWNKISTGGQARLILHGSKAFDIAVGLEGQKIFAVENDEDTSLPDDGFDLSGFVELKVKFTPFFKTR